MLEIGKTFTYQKYSAKRLPFWFIGYDHNKDMRVDAFLQEVEEDGPALRQKFDADFTKEWNQRGSARGEVWHMIVEGQFTAEEGGGNAVALFQVQEEMEKVRDECYSPLAAINGKWSRKGGYCYGLEDAKKYLQMARDEEGDFFHWPETIPVFWEQGTFEGEEDEGWYETDLREIAPKLALILR